MSIWSYIAVFVGGGLGSLSRFIISQMVVKFHYKGLFPLATFLANMLATAILAFIVINTLNQKIFTENQRLFWAVGFCGGFSTFSTFSYENWLLYRQGNYGVMAVNILISLLLGIGLFAILSKTISE